jgi:hypothetical protein
MSYSSSFVQAQPTAEIAATSIKTATKNHASAVIKKEITTKILLFIAIISCLVLAVNI